MSDSTESQLDLFRMNFVSERDFLLGTMIWLDILEEGDKKLQRRFSCKK